MGVRNPGSTASCEQWQSGINAETAIAAFRASFEKLHATVQANVAAAEQAIVGVNDPALQARLDEAEHNLAFAEGDESGGFHNPNYVMALLNDANERALEGAAPKGTAPQWS
jgi:hypothetical protein